MYRLSEVALYNLTERQIMDPVLTMAIVAFTALFTSAGMFCYLAETQIVATERVNSVWHKELIHRKLGTFDVDGDFEWKYTIVADDEA